VGVGGDDRIEGAAGNDTMFGGAGAERFKGGAGVDSAPDFNTGEGDTQEQVEQLS
jgi:Ca2+-binding RTX toxin-like protein